MKNKKSIIAIASIIIILPICVISILFYNKSIKPILKPYEIEYDSQILSYYNNIDNFNKNVFTIQNLINIQKRFEYYENTIFVNNNNKIRFISILDDNIKTHKDIYVGDDISKIKSQYKYENNSEGKRCSYSIRFDGDWNEVPYKSEEYCLTINYYYEDDVITRIEIYDKTFGTLLMQYATKYIF